jgi:TusA-related sulfurtransferase
VEQAVIMQLDQLAQHQVGNILFVLADHGLAIEHIPAEQVWDVVLM